MKRHTHYIIFTSVFILILVLPYLNQHFKLITAAETKENRLLNKAPEFNLSLLDPFPNEYENYYNDHFGLRSSFLELNNYVLYKKLKRSSVPNKVIIGNDDWFFYNNVYLPDRSFHNLFNPKKLQKVVTELQRRNKYLKERNCQFFLAIVPAKASIYPENTGKRADSLIKGFPYTRTDQFMDFMANYPEIITYDLRIPLRRYRDSLKLYHQHDHHWNQLGGFIASEYLIQEMAKIIPSINTDIDINQYNITYQDKKGGDLSNILGVSQLCCEKNPLMEPKKKEHIINSDHKLQYQAPKNFAYSWGYEVRRYSNAATSPKLLVIRDSYGSYIKNPISRGFCYTTLIWDAWQYKLNEPIVEKEKPDVFLLMVSEENLHKLLN